jgi:hypothetical protein
MTILIFAIAIILFFATMVLFRLFNRRKSQRLRKGLATEPVEIIRAQKPIKEDEEIFGFVPDYPHHIKYKSELKTPLAKDSACNRKFERTVNHKPEHLQATCNHEWNYSGEGVHICRLCGVHRYREDDSFVNRILPVMGPNCDDNTTDSYRNNLNTIDQNLTEHNIEFQGFGGGSGGGAGATGSWDDAPTSPVQESVVVDNYTPDPTPSYQPDPTPDYSSNIDTSSNYDSGSSSFDSGSIDINNNY